ncbi:putative magnesium transporter YhiD [Gracilariopsis chorda]|uniref:Putative magnesium transporter YhiD n=1 Tax=Gracilariopsis chorda TaxID=448386 RepID=A0A2V3IJ08_9FLOR|nr:putative magnesium transporter YhiD [Gracilariopsis chorda]|eukprot:PXF42076.1 putative magnesium transporter YhiD [Gracilariopsis chorda]
MSRMGVAIACGALIGVERRTASANAGIRTMSLVSLGSAIFALTSLVGLGGDPSRMGAAISTGIGFLGSGAITDVAGRRQLVTAASIWIAAAVGVAAACGLYRLAVSGAALTVCILRWRLIYSMLRKRLKRVKDNEEDGIELDADGR